MTHPDLERLKSWFAEYASGFYTASFREMRKGRYIERLSASMPATADMLECVRMAREHLCRQTGCAV